MSEKEIRSINGMPLKDAKARTSLDTFKKETSLQIKDNMKEIEIKCEDKLNKIKLLTVIDNDPSITDYTAIINNAIENSSKVVLNTGEYRLSSKIKINNKNNFILEAINNAVIVRENMGYDGNTPNPEDHFIQVTKSNNVEIRGLNFINRQTNGVETYSDSFGILINEKAPTETLSNIKIKNCCINGTRSAGIVARNVDKITVDNNSIYNTGRDGIQIMGNDFIVTNNRIENSKDDAIAVNGGTWGHNGKGIVSNNIINGCISARAIAIVGCRDVIAESNIIKGYATAGIMVLCDDSAPVIARIKIHNNIISDCLRPTNFDGGTGGIIVLGYTDTPVSDTEYDGRVLDATQYAPKDISITNNLITTTEDCGKTLFGLTVQYPKYGIRIIRPANNINIDSNTIYNVDICFNMTHPTGSVYRINNNIFRRFKTCFLLSSAKFIQDVSISNNYIDGLDLSNTFNNPCAFNIQGIHKLLITNNNVKNCTKDNVWGGNSAIVQFNSFENAPQIGYKKYIYDTQNKTFTYVE